jgi:DNA-binding SARP family transcriptional activator/Tfp pilus assembly protein PilF/TolB-like protein
VRRDALVALFWPELGEEEGRRALRQALHYLRRAVGDVFAATAEEVGIRDGAVRCDALEFERLADAGQPDQALELYRGDFFTSFHVDDVSAEYEEWVERTRTRLRRKAAATTWLAAESAEKRGETELAIDLGRRACDLEPDHEAGWRRLMSLHERIGDRAGALRTFGELADRLDREFDAKPSPETTALAESIRRSSRNAAAAIEPEPVAPFSSVSAAPKPLVVEPVAPPATRSPRWFKPVAIALTAVVLAAAWLTYIRLSESAGGPSLVSAGTLAPKDRILVAEFENQAGDSSLAASVTDAFRIDLAQSPLVRVSTPQQVRATLRLMEQSATAVAGDSLAREVAVRQGAKAIVTGAVGKVGSAYTVSVRLIGAARGEGIASFRETASDSTRVIGAVDRVSKELRHRIGESLRDLRDMPPLYEATTRSLPALREYTDANRLSIAGRRTESVPHFQNAVALDTGFASAWMALGMVYGSIAQSGRALAADEHAMANQQRLTLVERAFLVGSHAHGRGDYDTAIEAYTKLLERYPDNFRALNNLALAYRNRRQFAIAESLFTRAAQIDTTIPNLYFGIHGSQLLAGKFAESRRTLDLIGRRFPGNPVLMTMEMQDAAAQQNWGLAERHAEARIAALQSDSTALIDPFEALAGIAMTEGRLAESEGYWKTQLALSAKSRSWGRHLGGVTQVAYLELRHRHNPARALAFMDSALARTPMDSVLPGDRPYDELARFYAEAGRLTRAREMMAAADTNDRRLGRTPGPDRAWTRGVLALAEGKPRDAEPSLREAADADVCTICALPDLARAYESEGKSEAAVAAYERYLTTPWFYRYAVDASELGWALKRLAELYDARGERGKASAARAKLLQLWRRADPELQPIVSAVRAKVPG